MAKMSFGHRRFTLNLIPPAIGLTFAGDIFVDRQWYKIVSWIIPVLYWITWFRIETDTSFMGEDVLPLFAFALPPLILVYGFCWLYPLYRDLFSKMRMTIESTHWGKIVPATLIPLFSLGCFAYVFALIAGNVGIDSVVAGVGLATVAFVFLFLLDQAVAGMVRSRHRRRVTFFAFLGPLVGIQGLGYFIRGDILKGLFFLWSGWGILIGFFLLLPSASSEEMILLHTVTFPLGILYLFGWAFGVADALDESSPRPERKGRPQVATG